MIHHFILTRFCLDLWSKDKTETNINKKEWLKHRLNLFETYCLPSIISQSKPDFEWLLLVSPIKGIDNEWLKSKLQEYKAECPQIKIVGVKPEASWKFACVFREAVKRRLAERNAKSGDICLTTYFDNDDILASEYIEKVQELSTSLRKNTFISFDYGYQYFTELDIQTRIRYTNNHFMTMIEGLDDIKTCYGYGSHFLLEEKHLARVHHVKDKKHPMWTEVIHESNVDNDVKMTFDTKITKGTFKGKLRFYMRALSQIKRRAKDKIIPRKW